MECFFIFYLKNFSSPLCSRFSSSSCSSKYKGLHRKAFCVLIAKFYSVSCSVFIEPFTKQKVIRSPPPPPLPELSLTKAVLKICSKFKGEHPCRSVILLKSHLHMGVLLYICWIMSEQLLMRARLEDCFWKTSQKELLKPALNQQKNFNMTVSYRNSATQFPN